MKLLDANLLIALAWPIHLHHKCATAWFEKNYQQGWATCSINEMAFVRISSNPKIFASAPNPRAAVAMLESIHAIPGHRFWEESPSISRNPFLPHLVGHQQVTDAQLLHIAAAHEGQLVSFDRGIERLIPKTMDLKALLQILVLDAPT